MSGDRFDYRSERARHENFVGRTELLARLDQLLVEDAADRWVVVTGGPGMGKSALLAAWLAHRVAAGAVVPHHFIRRGLYDWDDPAKLVGSLVVQIEDGFPELRDPEADERMHPAMRLSRALSRVSEQALLPHGARLVVLIDGLDEYDPPPERSPRDPVAAFLPDTLPAGVRLLCASRPRHPYVSSLDARDCELVQIDLDDPSHAADNEATVRAFWSGAAEPLHLDARFVDEAVARAGGNVQHAVQLRKRLAVLPPEQRRVEDIPRGLAALIEKAWARVARIQWSWRASGSCAPRARRSRSTRSARWRTGAATRIAGRGYAPRRSCSWRPSGREGNSSTGCTTTRSADTSRR